ncbi:hypothetical protein EP7_002191 [Isosphaeraceae bacterium EP7]
MSRQSAVTGGASESKGSQPAPETNVERNRPVHSVSLRNIRAAVWANDGEQGACFNATLARLYKDGEGNWRSSESFGRDDLLLLAKVADMAHTWISEQLQAQDVPF